MLDFFDKELVTSINNIIDITDKFNNDISLLTHNNDFKKIKEVYYLYAVELKNELEAIDKLTAKISKNLQSAYNQISSDMRNIYSELFEKSISYRKITEEYLSQTEHLLRVYSDKLIIELKNLTFIFMRKSILIKNEI